MGDYMPSYGFDLQQPLGQPPQPGQPGRGGGVDDPAFIATMMKLQNPGAQAKMARQMKLADTLRNAADAQLQGQQAGRVYRAPGLLNLVANVMGNTGAAQTAAEADASGKQMDTDLQGAGADYMRRWARTRGYGGE